MWKYFLAIKYLGSRPINLIGAVGITLAVWALILVVSIFTGYIREMKLHIRGTASDLSFLFNHSQDPYERIEPLLLADPGVRAAAPRLSWYGLLDPQQARKQDAKTIDPAATAGKPATNFFQIVGIDVARESVLRNLQSELSEFERPEDRKRFALDPAQPFMAPDAVNPEHLPGIVVGLSRADKVGWDLERGDVLTLTTARQAPRGSDELVYSINQRFVLTGVFTSRHHEFENATALIDIAVMRGLMEQRGARVESFNEIAIALAKETDPDTTQERLRKVLADQGILGRVYRWDERPRFARFLENVVHQRSLMTLVLGILMIVSCFLIFATLLMMVAEKTRDIGILAALGATRRGTLTVFLLCGFAISASGAIIGTLGSWYTCLHLNDVNDWLAAAFDLKLFPKDIYGLKEVPYDLDPLLIAFVIAGAIALTLMFSLIPATMAARLDPVRALRRE